jgi:hypothetical protein
MVKARTSIRGIKTFKLEGTASPPAPLSVLSDLVRLSAQNKPFDAIDAMVADEVLPVLVDARAAVGPVRFLDAVTRELDGQRQFNEVGACLLMAFCNGLEELTAAGREAPARAFLRRGVTSANETFKSFAQEFISSHKKIFAPEKARAQRAKYGIAQALAQAMTADEGSEEELIATVKVVELAAQIRKEKPFAAFDALVAVSDFVDEGSDLERLVAQGAERTLRVIEEKHGFSEALDVVTGELTQMEESHPLNEMLLRNGRACCP